MLKKYRNVVMKLVYEIIMVGYFGVKKIIDRLILEFYWFGVFVDIRRYC